MNNIKVRVIATTLSAITIISAVSIVSVGAVKKAHYDVSTSTISMKSKASPEERKAYMDAKVYLDNMGFKANIVKGSLKNPDTGSIYKYKNSDEYNKMLTSYKMAKSHLKSLGYSHSVINSVVVLPSTALNM